MQDQRNLVCVGIITKAHGVKGHVCVKSYCDDPEALFDFGVLTNAQGDKTYVLDLIGTTRDVFTVKVNDISDRNEAELLSQTELYVKRDVLPSLEDDSEFYVSDLEGKQVKAADGTEFGSIVSVVNFGASDILEIRPTEEKATIYLPFLEEYVPVVDLDGGYIQISESAQAFIQQIANGDKP